MISPDIKRFAIGLCQDDDERVGLGCVAFGLVAGGLACPNGQGNQELYPDETRLLMEKAAPIVHRHLAELAAELGMTYGVTSHEGCGGGAAQNVSRDELPAITQSQMEANGVPFWGHVPVSQEPVPLSNMPGASACITRDFEDHEHLAQIIGWTVGGGRTQDKSDEIERRHGHPFFVSTEGIGRGVRAGDLTYDEAAKLLLLQDTIAQTIAPGVSESGERRHVFIDEGRLEQDEVRGNASLAQSILGLVPQGEVDLSLIVRLD